MILTGVGRVCLNYNTPRERELETLIVDDAKRYMEEGQFGAGSMLPKVQACLSFLEAMPKGRAIIASLDSAKPALAGKTGTLILNP